MIRSALFAGLTTVAFGYLYQLAGVNLWIAGAIGAMAWMGATLVGTITGAGLLPDFMGSLIVGILSEFFAIKKRQPVTLFMVPAIISFVPGYLVYQAMVAFLKGHSVTGIRIGFTALFAAAALSLGLALATAVFRPMLRRTVKARPARSPRR